MVHLNNNTVFNFTNEADFQEIDFGNGARSKSRRHRICNGIKGQALPLCMASRLTELTDKNQRRTKKKRRVWN
jgi:hypothetical protein